ncbi:MAG TPA: sigma-70 family RNA polymerase sigma factor [Candidatus Udaeobacter sp.]|nr:sigma-70 family RNA polymerase sigma factor [Candidatus Udaeobacter sp.]
MLPGYRDAVKRYVHFRLAPRIDRAEDVVQEVFLAACENLGAYRGSSSLESWLMGIARNKVPDYYRAHSREPQALEPVEPGIKIDSPHPEFDDHLDKESARKKTWEILKQLPEKYRCALVWRYWDECSIKTMAMRIGKTEKAMERILARARDEFRWAWDQQ